MSLFQPITNRQANVALTVLRVIAGATFIAHGAQKLFVFGFAGVSGAFAQMGVPAAGVMGPFIALLEFFGGIALVFGLLTRLAALGLAFDMVSSVGGMVMRATRSRLLYGVYDTGRAIVHLYLPGPSAGRWADVALTPADLSRLKGYINMSFFDGAPDNGMMNPWLLFESSIVTMLSRPRVVKMSTAPGATQRRSTRCASVVQSGPRDVARWVCDIRVMLPSSSSGSPGSAAGDSF